MAVVEFLLACLIAFQTPAASDDNTVWSGGIGTLNDQLRVWDPATLELEPDGNELRGRLKKRKQIYKVAGSRNGSVFEFTLERRDIMRSFRGQLVDDGRVLIATAVDGESPDKVIVRKTLPIAGNQLNHVTGIYAFDDQHRVSLREQGGSLALTDFKTGKVRTLYSSSADQMVAGPGMALPHPAEVYADWQRDARGNVTGMKWTQADSDATLVAQRVAPPTISEFEYDSFDGTRIRGSLFVPPNPGPHPAIVWVHGSGKAARDSAGSWPQYFSDLGFAVLAVDKRGVGKSDGVYHLPDGGGRDNFPHMRRRAQDVAAAVKALAKREDVLANRIGLVGASQAGWVIPMTVDQADISFAIILSGGATPLSVEGRFSRLAAESSSGADLKSVDELIQELREYQPADEGIDSELSRMDYPCLWLYGLKDRSNPSQLCAERIQRIAARHERDFSVKLFPDGNHALLVCQFGGAAEMRSLDRLVPGLHTTIEAWLKEKQLLPVAKSR